MVLITGAISTVHLYHHRFRKWCSPMICDFIQPVKLTKIQSKCKWHHHHVAHHEQSNSPWETLSKFDELPNTTSRQRRFSKENDMEMEPKKKEEKTYSKLLGILTVGKLENQIEQRIQVFLSNF